MSDEIIQPTQKPTLNPSRVVTVDLLKGITISLVVMRHLTEMADLMPDKIFYGLGLVRMPLFFFLSGIFLKPITKQTLLRKFSQLMLPFYIASIFFGTIYLYILDGDPLRMYLGIAYGTGQSLPVSPLWFLPTLFFSAIVTSVAIRVNTISKSNWILAIFMLLCALTIHRVVNPKYVYEFTYLDRYYRFRGGFLNLDLIPIASIFLAAGYLAKSVILKDRYPHWLGAASAVVFLFFFLTTDAYLDMDKRQIKEPLYALLASSSGIVLFLYVGKQLAKIGVVRNSLTALGKVSLYILIYHNPIKFFFNQWITTTEQLRAIPWLIVVRFIVMLVGSYFLGVATLKALDQAKRLIRRPRLRTAMPTK